MTAKFTPPENTLLVDWWISFRALPGWVQIWVMLILVPVNMLSLAFLAMPLGVWIAFLAIIAMALNLPIMWVNRGFSNAMALPHLLPWTILVLWLLFARPEASGLHALYLSVLLVVDAISLMFDYPDAIKWLRGDRTVAGRS